MKLKALLMMWVLAGVFFAAQGWAVPVSYIVKGTLGMVPFYGQELIPFAPGDVFTVSYTFNDAMDQLLDAENSSYNLTGFSFSITSDGNDYSTNILETTSYPNFVLHQNDYYDLYDSAQLTAFSGALNEGTFALNAAIIYARDASKSVLTSPVGAFPDTVNENDFTQFGYFLAFTVNLPDNAGSAYIELDGGNITYFRVVRENISDPTNPVPEPATLMLFGAGLAGLAAAGRRRRL